jgi:hypothetical protein
MTIVPLIVRVCLPLLAQTLRAVKDFEMPIFES